MSLIGGLLIPSIAWANYGWLDCIDNYLGVCAGVGVDILAIPMLILIILHYRNKLKDPQYTSKRMLFVVFAYAVYFITFIYFLHNLATGGSCNPMAALTGFLLFGMLFPIAMLVHSVLYLFWKIRA